MDKTTDFKKSILLIIDVQNDFCPGGALAVNEGDMVVEPINNLSHLFSKKGSRIIATQDWHPQNHVSFASSHPGKTPGALVDLPDTKGQVLWPSHCVEGTDGACFHKNLDLNPVHLIIRKGFRETLDSYSAFFENDRKTSTGLEGFLKGLSIENIFLCGLATDYCVFYSAVDSVNAGFKTFLVKDAVRGVGYPEGSVEKALSELAKLGVEFVDSKNFV